MNGLANRLAIPKHVAPELTLLVRRHVQLVRAILVEVGEHRRVLEAIDFGHVSSNGYSFQIEMNYRAWRKGFALVEVPITFTERTEGQSKMSKGIVREATLKVWELRFRALTGKL